MSGCVGAAEIPPVPLHQALLWDAYPTVVVEINAVPGLEPKPAALDALRAALNIVGHKQEILIVGPNPIPAQGGDYRDVELLALHKRWARFAPPDGLVTQGGRAYLHILVLDGRMLAEGDNVVAGRTLREGAIILLPETYNNASTMVFGRLVPAHGAERHVLLHELGHAMGLVNRGVPMVIPHEDTRNPGHSANATRLLAARMPLTKAQVVTGPFSSWYDEDDLRDVQAFQRTQPVAAAA